MKILTLTKTDGMERGTVFVLVSLFLVGLVAVVGFSVDIGRTFNEQREIQFAVDAAALAGVNKLALPSPSAQAAHDEAEFLAQTNELVNFEIQSIEVGFWNDGTRVFTADPYPYANPPHNAVHVVARRTVGTVFAHLVGTDNMSPIVEAIATIGTRCEGECLIPVAVQYSKIFDPNGDTIINPLQPGDVFYLTGQEYEGNWGVVGLNPLDPNSPNGNEVTPAITTGQCDFSVPSGDGVPYDPNASPPEPGYTTTQGSAISVCNGFQQRIADQRPIVTMPIIANGDMSGTSHVEVVGFIRTRIEWAGRDHDNDNELDNPNNPSCSGENMKVKMTVLPPGTGGGDVCPGGGQNPPLDNSRSLVSLR